MDAIELGPPQLMRGRWTASFVVVVLSGFTAYVATQANAPVLPTVLFALVASTVGIWVDKRRQKAAAINQRVSHIESLLAETKPDGALWRVNEVPLEWTGTHNATIPVPHVERKQEAVARESLRRRKAMVVIGPPISGKSHLAFCVAQGVVPDHYWVHPRGPSALSQLLSAYQLRNCLVWLDRLEEHLQEESLTPSLITRLAQANNHVVGTISHEAYRSILGGALGATSVLLAETMHPLFISPWEPSESEAAAQAGVPPDVIQSLGAVGLPAYVGGGVALYAHAHALRVSEPDAYQLLLMSCRWRAVGMKAPLSHTQLEALFSRADSQGFASALATLQNPLANGLTPLEAAESDTAWSPSGYLVARLQEDGELHLTAGDWEAMLACCDSTQLTDFAFCSLLFNESAVFERASQLGSESGNLDCLRLYGYSQLMQGRTARAERAWKDGAERGDVRSWSPLAQLQMSRGRMKDAVSALRHAAESGYPPAMVDLAIALHGQGDVDGAAHWLQKAADGSYPPAMTALGGWLVEDGDEIGGEQWYRKAADLGEPQAMAELARALMKGNRLASAERWARRGAMYGDPGALSLAAEILMENNGNLLEARAFANDAAKLGNVHAENLLGLMAGLSSPTSEEAGRRFKRAWDGGCTGGLLNYARWLEVTGESNQAITHFRIGAKHNDRDSILGLIRIYKEKGDQKRVARWSRALPNAEHDALLNMDTDYVPPSIEFKFEADLVRDRFLRRSLEEALDSSHRPAKNLGPSL